MRRSKRSWRANWLIPMSLAVLSAVPVAAGLRRLIELAGDPIVSAANARFVARPLPVVLHIVSVIPYSLLGALQFAPGLRRRGARWHRAAGAALVPLGLTAALTGLWMAHFYPWPAGDGQALYAIRMLVGAAMVAAIVAGVDALRRKDFPAHGRWMIRAYALGMGAGTQVLTHLPWFVFIGQPGELARTVLMAAGWAINIAVGEAVLSRMGRPAAHPPMLEAASERG